MLLPLALLLSTAALPAPAPPASVPAADDVAERLRALEHVDAAQRREAQRWLSVHLNARDYPAVAGAAGAGGAETSLRLAQALGGEDRHLGLAALLAADEEPRVARLGEAALREQLLRWSSSAFDVPQRRRTLPDGWVDDWPRRLSLDPELGGLAAVVERLDRLGRGPAPLVLDPRLDPDVRTFVPDRAVAGERLEGSWSLVLLALARAHQLSFEVHGHRDEGDEGSRAARPWVRVCLRGTEGGLTGGDLLIEWARGSLRAHDPVGNRAACRALAAVGWPAALAWLGARWEVRGDEAALEGLLLAAAQGRVARELLDPAAVRALLARADADPEGLGERVARALAGLGALARDGSPLAPVLLEGWEERGAASRWVRLVALEGMAAPSPEATRRCDELLDSDAPTWLRRQALRTRARVGLGGAPLLRAPAALLEDLADDRAAELLARDLVAVGASPARGWSGAAGSTTGSAHLALGLWALGLGEVEPARGALGRRLGTEGPAELAARLRRWGALGAGTELGRLAAAPAPGGVPSGDWRQLLLLAGAVPAEGLAATVDALLARAPQDPAALLELGAVAAVDGSAGTRARQALIRALEGGTPVEDLLPALEVAVQGLRRARLDSLDEAFQARLRTTAARSGHPAAGTLYSPGWPKEAASGAPRLEDLDRFR